MVQLEKSLRVGVEVMLVSTVCGKKLNQICFTLV